MNKTFLAIFLIAMVSSSAAFEIDIAKCMAAAGLFIHDLKLIIDETKAEKKSIDRFLNATYNAAEAFNPLLHSCGIDIPAIDKIDSFTFNDTDHCFEHVEAVALMTNNIFELIKGKSNLIVIIQDITALFKQIKETKTLCSIVPKPTTVLLGEGASNLKIDLLQCLKDSKVDYTQIMVLVADYTAFKNKTLPLEELLAAGLTTYNDIAITFQDCDINVNLPVINSIDEIKACIKDVEGIVAQVEQSIQEFQDKNFIQLIHTLQTIGQEILEIKNTCVHKPTILNSGVQNLKIDVLQCFKDAKMDYTQFKVLAADYTAFKNKTLPIEELFAAGLTSYNDVALTLKDCHIYANLPIINSIDEIKTCIKDVEGIVANVQQAVQQFKSKSYVEFIKTLESIGKEILDIKNTCVHKPTVSLNSAAQNLKIDVLQCFKDAKMDYTQFKVLAADYTAFKNKTLPIEELFAAGLTSYNDVAMTLKDCNIYANLPIINSIDEIKTCIKDVEGIVANVQQAVQQFKAKSYVEFIKTLESIGKEILDIKNTCVHKPTVSLNSAAQNLKIDVLQCFKDAKMDYTQFKVLAADYTAFKNKTLPLEELIAAGITSYNDVAVTLKDCDIKANLPIINGIDEIKACIKDVEGIVANVQQAVQQFKSKSYIEFIHTLQSIGKEVLDIKNTCVHKKPKFLEAY